MKTFADNAGRTWTVAINVDAVKRVRDLAHVNLLEVIEGKLLEKLIGDPVLLCDVIYSVCKPEADAKNITDVDFGRAMGGDAIDNATTALLEELVDFFPQGRRRVLSKALAKLRTFETAALNAVETRLESKELARHMAAALAELEVSLPGNLSGSAPASSGSTPAPRTLRELIDMAQARQQDQWNHSAALMALLANINRDPKRGRAMTPADFHPLLAPAQRVERPLQGDIGMLKAVFVDNAPNRRQA